MAAARRHVSAVLLPGPIFAAIVFAAREAPVRVPRPAFVCAQAVVGCMIARTIPATLVGEVGQSWSLFVAGKDSVVQLSALLGWAMALAHFAHVDPLTAYLATSPGGADTMAIIANPSPVDVPFVMAMQSARFIVVAFCGPAIARFVARRIPA